MLRRRRSNNGNLAAAASNANNNSTHGASASAAPGHAHQQQQQQQQQQQANGNAPNLHAASSSTPNPASFGPAHRIRLVPHLDPQRALHFDPIVRECREGAPAIRIGRFTDRSGTLAASTNSLTGKIAFKSKVVSRGHAELWCEPGGKFYVKDTSSSSGTFLNHMRLSHAGVESRPFLLKDGDILQLGVDYQGGTEEIYRCVKIRIEIGREWQAGPNPFNTNALAQLKSLSNLPTSVSAPAGAGASSGQKKPKKSSVSDCCICLFPVTVCQALFIAPCSHSFHYKCIRGTLVDNHPGFSCPLCRSFHDLEADVEVDIEEEEEWEELPEPVAAAPAVEDTGAEADGEADVSAAVHNDHTDMEIVDVGLSGHVSGMRRSVDDDDDAPHGFRTAAEDTGRSVLLPQGLRPQVPPLPPAPSNTTPRRTPRRNMTQGSGSNHVADDIDRGFETDGGVIGFGAETDMDVDEPMRGHSASPGGGPGHLRSASGRNRSTIYNLVHGASNSTSTSTHPTGSGTVNNHGYSGMSSAPNLLRPGSSMGHNVQYVNNGSGMNGTVTPPPPAHGPSTQPYPIRSPTTSHQPHALVHSSSNGGVPRATMSGSLPSGSGTHLFGDSGAGPAVPDKDRPQVHPSEDGMLEERPLDPNASGFLGFGSKRKR